MIEPLDPYRSSDTRYHSPEGTGHIIIDKLNEVIAVLNKLEQEVNALQSIDQKQLNRRFNDRITKLASDIINLKSGHTLFEKEDQPCEHGDEIPAFCKFCQDKPAPCVAEGRKKFTTHAEDNIQVKRVIGIYKAELKQKVGAMKDHIGNREGYYNKGLLHSLNDVLKLLEEDD